MKQQRGRSNLEGVFEIEEIPSDTQRREILDGASTEPLRRVLPQTFEQRRRVGGTTRFVTAGAGEKYSTTAWDGSEYFPSTKLQCPGCLRQQSAKGETHSSPLVVAATVTRAGSHEILPLEAEAVRNEAGQPAQAGALTAAKRWVKRRREEHRPLKLCLLGDDLYGHEPFILELRQLRRGFVLVAKPTAHAGLFERVAALERRGECVRGTWEAGPGSKRRSGEYRSATPVPLTQAGQVRVNFVEVWDRAPAGTVLSPNSGVTEVAVTRAPGATIVGMGRSRWKSETAQFNVQKNHG